MTGSPHNPNLGLVETRRPPREYSRCGSGLSSRRSKGRHRVAFSLLETTIAVGILGVGLIMVATIFPVALFQHRASVYQARSTELVSKASAMLRSKVDPNTLWSKAALLNSGLDSPWYVLPFANLPAGGLWEPLAQAAVYSNGLNLAPLGANVLDLVGADTLSDKYAPADDNGAQRAAIRLVWIGFYRRLANGSVSYAVAICRQQRGELYAEQDTAIPDFAMTPMARLPTALATDGRRFPVPWRVRVSRDAVTGRLFNAGGESLGELAPTGTKIMIQGEAYPPTLRVPPGRIYTVSNVFSPSTVEVREDVTDLPLDTLGSFDVWVFPPPAISGDATNVRFGNDSPVLDWKVGL